MDVCETEQVFAETYIFLTVPQIQSVSEIESASECPEFGKLSPLL